MQLHAGLVGRRVVVRRILPGERGPTGGPAFSDVIGVLELWDDDRLGVRRESGELVIVPRDQVVAGKAVPPKPRRRP